MFFVFLLQRRQVARSQSPPVAAPTASPARFASFRSAVATTHEWLAFASHAPMLGSHAGGSGLCSDGRSLRPEVACVPSPGTTTRETSGLLIRLRIGDYGSSMWYNANGHHINCDWFKFQDKLGTTVSVRAGVMSAPADAQCKEIIALSTRNVVVRATTLETRRACV